MKKEVSNEILKNKNLIEHFRKKVWEIRNILNEGKDNFKWEIKTQYDLDKGILYFSPQNYIEWVKMWPLRLVQYSYALSLMRKIRDSWTHLEFIEKIPTNMLDRLDFLLNENLIDFSENEIEDLKYIYSCFLKIHHQLQYESFFSDKTDFYLDEKKIKRYKRIDTYIK